MLFSIFTNHSTEFIHNSLDIRYMTVIGFLELLKSDILWSCSCVSVWIFMNDYFVH